MGHHSICIKVLLTLSFFGEEENKWETDFPENKKIFLSRNTTVSLDRWTIGSSFVCFVTGCKKIILLNFTKFATVLNSVRYNFYFIYYFGFYLQSLLL